MLFELITLKWLSCLVNEYLVLFMNGSLVEHVYLETYSEAIVLFHTFSSLSLLKLLLCTMYIYLPFILSGLLIFYMSIYISHKVFCFLRILAYYRLDLFFPKFNKIKKSVARTLLFLFFISLLSTYEEIIDSS